MNYFFDSNIIVYAYDPDAGVKRSRAHDLIDRHARDATLTVSTQVLQESYVNLVRRRHLKPDQALRVVGDLADSRVVPADAASVLRGLQLSQRHQLSPWDGSIVQAALDAGCTVLYTEDLQAGQRFGDLEIVNPFDEAVHAPRAAWPAVAAKKAARKPAAKRTAKR